MATWRAVYKTVNLWGNVYFLVNGQINPRFLLLFWKENGQIAHMSRFRGAEGIQWRPVSNWKKLDFPPIFQGVHVVVWEYFVVFCPFSPHDWCERLVSSLLVLCPFIYFVTLAFVACVTLLLHIIAWYHRFSLFSLPRSTLVLALPPRCIFDKRFYCIITERYLKSASELLDITIQSWIWNRSVLGRQIATSPNHMVNAHH